MTQYECPVCGKKFKEFPSQVNRTGCCSRRCYDKLPRPKRDLNHRFWEKVHKAGPDDCWEWMANRNKKGYGTFRRDSGRCSHAHRVAWELAHGQIPKNKLVLHNCPNGDNPHCCNPRHLWIGTVVENNEDRDLKCRTARGEKIRNSKLNELAVVKIRERYRQTEYLSQRHPMKSTFYRLAKEYKVSPSAVRSVVVRRTWKHV